MVRGAIVAAALALGACVSVPSSAPDAAPAGAYVADPAHTSLIWRVGHGNGLSRFTARFDSIEAALDFDPETPAASRLDVVIDPMSVNTGLADFDRQLATAANVFDGERHPQIRFVSRSIEVTGETTGRVTGELTMRGASAPVTLDVTYNGAAFDPLRGADVVGFSAVGVFSRAAFGADAWSRFGVGDEVEIQIEAEFTKT